MDHAAGNHLQSWYIFADLRIQLKWREWISMNNQLIFFLSNPIRGIPDLDHVPHQPADVWPITRKNEHLGLLYE